MVSLGGSGSGKKGKAPAAPKAPVAQLDNDVPGVEVDESNATPTAANSHQSATQVSGPPVTADGAVLITADELDDRVAKAVAKALALDRAEREAAPTPPAPASSDDTLAEKVAKSVALAMMANTQHQMNMQHEANYKAAMAKEAKVSKCLCCGQPVGGCGGPWVKKTDSDKLTKLYADNPSYATEITALSVDKEGFFVRPDGRRVEEFALNHKRMVVYPKNDENAEWFPGLKINNRWYRSAGPEHEIWVPAVNDFASVLAIFEQGEKRMRTPRKHVGSQGNGVVSGTRGVVSSPGTSSFL